MAPNRSPIHFNSDGCPSSPHYSPETSKRSPTSPIVVAQAQPSTIDNVDSTSMDKEPGTVCRGIRVPGCVRSGDSPTSSTGPRQQNLVKLPSMFKCPRETLMNYKSDAGDTPSHMQPGYSKLARLMTPHREVLHRTKLTNDVDILHSIPTAVPHDDDRSYRSTTDHQTVICRSVIKTEYEGSRHMSTPPPHTSTHLQSPLYNTIQYTSSPYHDSTPHRSYSPPSQYSPDSTEPPIKDHPTRAPSSPVFHCPASPSVAVRKLTPSEPQCPQESYSSSPASMTASSSSSKCSMSPPPPPHDELQHHPKLPEGLNGGTLYAVIDRVIIEFDGTTLLCRVCGDRSSGFHYGVHSCEGCKGFFRRSIQQKIQYRPCSKNQQCLVQKTNRNRCQWCRLKKCIEVGMSKDAVRFGRVPKNEKERIKLAMAQASSNIIQLDFSDEYLIETITRSHEETVVLATVNIIRKIEQHHTPATIDPFKSCPLNPYVANEEDFQHKFSPIVREVVAFAKNIPGFSEFVQDDKINLLRACVFEVLVIRFSSLIDAKNKRINTIDGHIIFASIYAGHEPSSRFVSSLFTFVERINSLKMTEQETALFTSALVVNPKRAYLHDQQKIAAIHKRIVSCLQTIMQKERPNNPNLCQDLLGTLNEIWMLNSMHSRQTQYKNKYLQRESSPMDIPSSHHQELPHSKYPSEYTEMPQTCPVRYASSMLSEYDDKRMVVDSPTSPTSTFSTEEEMKSPGSAESACSTDSGCSAESACSSDSGISVTSHISDNHRHVFVDEHRESLDDDAMDGSHKSHQYLSKVGSNVVQETTSTWHKPQDYPQTADKLATDHSLLKKALEMPSKLKMNAFKKYYQQHGLHPHKKFRPVMDRPPHPSETLGHITVSSRPSTTPSPSYSSSPSPSSSISSSPSRVSSSPYSSNRSSPCLLAQRLNQGQMNCTRRPKMNLAASSLSQSLFQEPKLNQKAALSEEIYTCIMKDQSRISLQGETPVPSPSRCQTFITSPMHHSSAASSPTHLMSSSPPLHGFNSVTEIPPAHSPPSSTPSGLGASAMSGCFTSISSSYDDDAQPLNLCTKTPSPPPAVMEA